MSQYQQAQNHQVKTAIVPLPVCTTATSQPVTVLIFMVCIITATTTTPTHPLPHQPTIQMDINPPIILYATQIIT